MSNRLFQGIIQQMKEAIDRVIGIVDENGIVIAASELSGIGETRQGVREELSYAGEMIRYEGYTYRPIGNAVKSEYIVFVEGTDQEYINQILDYNENAEHDDAPDSLASIVRKLWSRKNEEDRISGFGY